MIVIKKIGNLGWMSCYWIKYVEGIKVMMDGKERGIYEILFNDGSVILTRKHE